MVPMLLLTLPAFPAAEIPLFGQVTAKPFGLLVALGIVAGYFFMRARAKKMGLARGEIFDLALLCVAVGMLSAHFVDVLFYRPIKLDRILFDLVANWGGISSFGGFFGAVAASHWFARRKGRPWRLYADLLLQGLTLGWVFGRLGCAVVFDHPGVHSQFWLAMQYLDGPRHNLGFYEFLYTLGILLPASLLLHRFWPKAPLGSQTVLITLLYTPARFALDFLRANDVRHAGLTAAQWGCLAFFALALGFASRIRQAGQPHEDLQVAASA